jgi:hypothetical protein
MSELRQSNFIVIEETEYNGVAPRIYVIQKQATLESIILQAEGIL